jgi:hypothetical protein
VLCVVAAFLGEVKRVLNPTGSGQDVRVVRVLIPFTDNVRLPKSERVVKVGVAPPLETAQEGAEFQLYNLIEENYQGQAEQQQRTAASNSSSCLRTKDKVTWLIGEGEVETSELTWTSMPSLPWL